jgi:hypothetical protein
MRAKKVYVPYFVKEFSKKQCGAFTLPVGNQNVHALEGNNIISPAMDTISCLHSNGINEKSFLRNKRLIQKFVPELKS